MMKFWEFLKKNRWIGLILLVLLAFAGGVAAGRFGLPAKVVVTEKVRVVEKQVVVEKVRTEVRVEKVYLKNESQRVRRVVEERPDGSKTTTEDINVDSVVKENHHSTEVKVVDRVEWRDRVVEKFTEKKVLRQPDWRVYAGAGISIPYWLGQGEVGVPGMQGVVVQAGADRRLAGPVWFGLWGNTAGTVGLNVSASF